MYDPGLIAARETDILAQRPALRQRFPQGIPTFTRTALQADLAHLRRLWDDERKQLLRPLQPDEERLVEACQIRVAFDAPFFLEHFVAIDQEGYGLRSLYPLWESQRFILNRLAALQREQHAVASPNGLLLNVLKARQLGASTLAEALVAHRVLTRFYIRALVGADVEEQAGYLFRMCYRIYEHLPWFLQPPRQSYRRDREVVFGSRSSVRTAWGKSTRGGLVEESGRAKGQIGRGKTHSVVHISELSTWDNAGQLDDALLPGVPLSADALVLFESTAKGAGNWWHKQWLTAQEGVGRFRNVFIPWGVEPKKYALPAPLDWTPSSTTLQQAKKAETLWPYYTGAPITLTRDQLYWYETTRAYYESKGEHAKFLEEFASDPEECFQYSGRSVFTLPQLERIDAAARPLLDLWAVEPARDIAELRRLPAEDPPDRRLPPPAAPKAPRAELLVPPGYGFRRLGPAALQALPDLRQGVLAIWEYPRRRGRVRYIVSADVGDGVGLDYSVATVLRCPTLDDPAEEVAQYVSNTISPADFGRVVDALGHLYHDDEGIEACAAVECNIGPGLVTQNELQLHLGYTNFFVWEVLDAGAAEKRFTQRIGWATTAKTRPAMLVRFHEAVTTTDPWDTPSIWYSTPP